MSNVFHCVTINCWDLTSGSTSGRQETHSWQRKLGGCESSTAVMRIGLASTVIIAANVTSLFKQEPCGISCSGSLSPFDRSFGGGARCGAVRHVFQEIKRILQTQHRSILKAAGS
jgi:hypothetical protein